MKEREFAYKLRSHLNQSAHSLDRSTTDKLFQARQNALAHQKTSSQLSLAGFGGITSDVLMPHARTLFALIGLAIAIFGVNYWNDDMQAAETEEVDSALLSDDLPINAYLDRGFHAWLEQPSSQL